MPSSIPRYFDTFQSGRALTHTHLAYSLAGPPSRSAILEQVNVQGRSVIVEQILIARVQRGIPEYGPPRDATQASAAEQHTPREGP